MVRVWLLDSKGLANKLKNAGLVAAYEIKDCGATLECPNCQHLIDNSDVSQDWPGLPAGVKFDPSDVELLEHLAAKCGIGNAEPHEFIHEFIPTLEGDEGICYTHPENLPGARKDGSSIHFFYKIVNAYASGPRKRRRIMPDQENSGKAHVRWHKTGKTKPVIENVVVKGFKKVLVLYETSKKGSKPYKCNWIMHQYHLGDEEDESAGEYVVSKIFYQQKRETGNIENGTYLTIEESDLGTVQVLPRTPKLRTPDPPRPQETPVESLEELSQLDNETENATCLDGVDYHSCANTMDSSTTFGDPNDAFLTQDHNIFVDVHQQHANASCGFTELDNLELDALLDFSLSDLQFGSQDNLFDGLN